MTEIQRYLAEEVAEDHADGLVSRREALRRLGLLGLGGAAAASLLAGAIVDRAKAAVGVSAGTEAATDRGAASEEVTALQTREITFRGPRGRRLLGAWAAARRPRGGVLVIHENRGLNDSIRSVAGRLAASGYSSLAIDLLSEEGGTGSFADEFEAMAALGAAPPSRFVADMKAGVTELRRRVPGEESRYHRLLLRRRHGVAPPRVERVSPGCCCALLRAFPRERGPHGRQGCGARRLRRVRLESQRHPLISSVGSSLGWLATSDRDLPRRRSRVLQSDQLPVRPRSRFSRLSADAELVRYPRRDVVSSRASVCERRLLAWGVEQA